MLIELGAAMLWLAGLSQTPETALVPGPELTRELVPGESHDYRLNIEAAGNWLLSAEQRGIDVVLVVTGEDGRTLVAVDSPLDEYGTEWLLAEWATTGTYQLSVRARESTGAAGNYRLRAVRLEEPAGSRRLQAEQAATAAAAAYFRDSPTARRESVIYYEKAAGIWSEMGVDERAARAGYCAAVLHRILGDRQVAMTQAQRALALWKEDDNRRDMALALNEMGLLYLAAGAGDQARDCFSEAARLRRALGDLSGEGIARNNFCNTLSADPEAARSCLEEALAMFRRARSPRRQAAVHISLGRVCDLLADPTEARRHYDAALNLLRAGDDRYSLGLVYNHLGAFHRRLGQLQRALDHYRQALAIFVSLEEPVLEARTRNNLGNVLVSLGEPERARIQLERALELRRQHGDQSGEIATLFNLGLAYELNGQSESGCDFFSKAMALAQLTHRKRDQAQAHFLTARNLHARNQSQRALPEATAAIDLLKSMPYRRELANALWQCGAILVALGRYEQAHPNLEEALALYLAAENPIGQAQVHHVLALAAQAQHQIQPALAHARQAIDLLESVRASIAVPDLRTTFSAPRQEVYELVVALTMAAHRRDPAGGHDRVALEAAEKWRARGFRELMATSGQHIAKGIDAALKQRYEDASNQVNALADRRQKLLAAEADLTEVELALERAQGTLAARQAQLQNAAYGHILLPRAATAVEMLTLADPDTQVLVYSLGLEQSYVWLLDAGTIEAVEMPGRGDFDSLARRVHRRMASVDPRAGLSPYPEAISLSWMLLGPLIEKLHARRLVIVPDGALHYLPFAAMPVPKEGEPATTVLGDRFEIICLPSVSALIDQRRRQPASTQASKLLAIFADPVFDAGDPRIASPSTHRQGNPLGLTRLPATRREAESIAALAQDRPVYMALGFDAARDNLTDLAAYRFVHFATHGIIDASRPGLSGLVLSQRDEAGRPLDGFLRLHDIYNLDLNADLVVLSGCETALGREIRGEGLVGLTRGFMYAGARGVVASLWPVPDRATAELMQRFYAAMLTDRLPPATALQHAQQAIRRNPQWRQPYFWAAFVYQGDWPAPP